MSGKLWFCYERSAIGWTPVVYHDGKPERHKYIDRTEPQPVPLDCMNGDDPSFARLRERFAAPIDKMEPQP